jgi:exonuclease III
MKVISWNVRGLGRVDKRKEVRNLVREKHPLIVCLQETKLQVCDDSLCTSLWGSSLFGFSFRPSAGASGGLLTIWDTTEVEVWSSLSRDHVLWCHGRFITTGEEFIWWLMYMHCASLVPGKGCGIR